MTEAKVKESLHNFNASMNSRPVPNIKSRCPIGAAKIGKMKSDATIAEAHVFLE
jgi:hypothetical protein